MPKNRMKEYLGVKKVMDEYRWIKTLLGIVRKAESRTPGEKRSEKDDQAGGKTKRVNQW